MFTIKIRSKGVITLPAQLRRKYNWTKGQEFTLLDMGAGIILIQPGRSQVTETANRVAATLHQANVTLEDFLQTLDEERKRYFQENYGNLNG